jgi:hypothetical protein
MRVTNEPTPVAKAALLRAYGILLLLHQRRLVRLSEDVSRHTHFRNVAQDEPHKGPEMLLLTESLRQPDGEPDRGV